MIDDARLQLWIEHVFDHPASGPQWYFDADAPLWPGNGDDVPELMAATFERGDELLSALSDEELDQGFWYAVGDGSPSGWSSVLINRSTPAAMRLRVLRSFAPLFEKVMAVRCTQHLSHLSEAGAGALNSSCYMWWDLLNLNFAASEWVEFRPEMIAVLRRILAIPHDACRESALHGIGHLILDHAGNGEGLGNLIEEFLRSNPGVRPELAAYAASARRGCIQ
jgi:hypothetical protein